VLARERNREREPDVTQANDSQTRT
jgi:hypothetical protein